MFVHRPTGRPDQRPQQVHSPLLGLTVNTHAMLRSICVIRELPSRARFMGFHGPWVGVVGREGQRLAHVLDRLSGPGTQAALHAFQLRLETQATTCKHPQMPCMSCRFNRSVCRYPPGRQGWPGRARTCLPKPAVCSEALGSGAILCYNNQGALRDRNTNVRHEANFNVRC